MNKHAELKYFTLRSTLPGMVLDSDLNTRKFSSKAMIAAARDYNGRTALLEARKKDSEQ